MWPNPVAVIATAVMPQQLSIVTIILVVPSGQERVMGLLQMVLRFTSNQFFEHCSFCRLCSRRTSLRSLFQKHKFHVKCWKNELRHTCIIFSSILLQTSLSRLLTSPTKQVNNCHRKNFTKDK